MLDSAVIVFREVLEAALIIGIIAAATRAIPGRTRWLAGGVLAGLLGSAVLAASAGYLGQLASGMGQELFNAIILGIAVLMLAWHNIWMAAHGAELAASAKSVGTDIRDGRRELSILVAVVGIAVLREGSETVLFLYSIAMSTGGAASWMWLGSLTGLLAGIAVGWLLYAGLLRIPLRWFFTATGVLVLLLSANMASQAAHFLIQGDIITSLTTPLWDTSATLPDDKFPGILLKALVGYDSHPAGMQLVFYLAALLIIGAGMKWMAHKQAAKAA